MTNDDKKAFKQFIDDLTDCVSQTRFDKETLKANYGLMEECLKY